MSITIYHNPDCGTSRNTLALIRNSGAEPTRHSLISYAVFCLKKKMMMIFADNIIISRLQPLKYIFLTGQALLWLATRRAVIGENSLLTALTLILTGDSFCVLM
ncbi:PTS transporter subunit IIC, partial [Escherichia coli]|uniref:PTS transporter subunit IIC n=1 Tax=Escherichia coli TaxID=562 RepID=UPI00339CA54B